MTGGFFIESPPAVVDTPSTPTGSPRVHISANAFSTALEQVNEQDDEDAERDRSGDVELPPLVGHGR